jgi:opacity protein-like surface antigen
LRQGGIYGLLIALKIEETSMKKIFLSTAFALLSVGVQAQTYGEIGYASIQVKGAYGLAASPEAVRFILGYEVAPNLVVEGMLGFGLGKSNVKFDGVDDGYKLKLNQAVGLYAKPKVKLSEKVELYGRVGYARTSTTFESNPALVRSSFSYGAGLSYAINPSMSAYADHMQYFDKGGDKGLGLTFGVGFKF